MKRKGFVFVHGGRFTCCGKTTDYGLRDESGAPVLLQDPPHCGHVLAFKRQLAALPQQAPERFALLLAFLAERGVADKDREAFGCLYEARRQEGRR